MLCCSFALFDGGLSSEKECLLDNKKQTVCYALVKQEELLPYCGHEYIPYSDILMGLQSKGVKWLSMLPDDVLGEEDERAIIYKFECTIKHAKLSVMKNNLKDLSELIEYTYTPSWIPQHEIIPVTVKEDKEKTYVVRSEFINNSLEKRIR